MSDEKIKYTAPQLAARLRARYGDARRYAMFEEFPNDTGFAASTWIDVAVFSLWPSDGRRRSAFEIKVSRGDFEREMANPGKNSWARERFHEFWFVGPAEAIRLEELPDGVGWLRPLGAADGMKLAEMRPAAVREPVDSPGLLHALARKAADSYERGCADGIATARAEPDIAQAIVWRAAARKFLTSRNVYGEADDETAALAQIIRAADSDAACAARAELARRAHNFRSAAGWTAAAVLAIAEMAAAAEEVAGFDVSAPAKKPLTRNEIAAAFRRLARTLDEGEGARRRGKKKG